MGRPDQYRVRVLTIALTRLGYAVGEDDDDAALLARLCPGELLPDLVTVGRACARERVRLVVRYELPPR